MTRLLFLLSFSLLVAFALAAPVPKPKDNYFQKAPWGRPIDPDKDCKFTFRRGSVTIEVPGKPHDLTGWAFPRSNAPRLLRPAEGDFAMQARVTGPFKASGAAEAGGEGRLVAAGLILVVQGKPGGAEPKSGKVVQGRSGNVVEGMRYLTVEFGNRAGGRGRHDFHALDAGGGIVVRDDSSHKGWPFPAGAGSAYLKLQRKGESLTGYTSADGKEWSSFIESGIVLSESAKVKVGLFARSTSKDKFKATFDSFKLTPLKPKKD